LHVRRNKLYAFYFKKNQVRSYRKRQTLEILHSNFTTYFLYDVILKKIRRVEEKEDIFENSEFTCFCKSAPDFS